jgi:translation initiation factor 1
VIRFEYRKFRKPVTLIEGIPKTENLHAITKSLKTKLAAGGAVKDGIILLQGDHRFAVKDQLVRQLGFAETSIEVQG